MKYFVVFILSISLNAIYGQGIVNNSAYIINNGASKIVLNESAKWTNSGTFTADDSEVIFIGGSEQSILGSSNTSFNKLTLNKSANDLLIGVNISVTNNLTLTSGDLDLQDYTIDLGATGVIVSETENNRIKVGDPLTNIGTIQYTRTINNVTDYDPANLGVSITTNQNLGSITVVRGHLKKEGVTPNEGNYGIARYYTVPGIGEIDGTNNNLVFSYWNSELNEDQPIEGNLILYQSITEDATNYWTDFSANIDTDNNQIVPSSNPYSAYVYGPNYADITFNSVFTLGSEEAPLPIELLEFVAKNYDHEVKLSWMTSSEINSNYFVIQRSADAKDWQNISQKDAAGNSNTISSYNHSDLHPLSGLAYYRLKQVDKDGKYSYSNTQTIYRGNDNTINIYPNPTNGYISIKGSSINNIELINLSGKTVLEVNSNFSFIDLRKLRKGTYIIKIQSGREIFYQRIILI